MLVLSRRAGETIVFPSLGITVRVVRSRGGAVRLGVEAPRGVKVVRGELLAVTLSVPEVVTPPLS
jgi:carbon storage regulator CsrA